jgi:hypothetical protein
MLTLQDDRTTLRMKVGQSGDSSDAALNLRLGE